MAVHVICSVAVNILEQKGITLPVEFSLIISELMIFIPALIYVINSRLSFSEDLGFRGVKLGTALISVFMSFLVWGVGSFFNVLSLYINLAFFIKKSINLSYSFFPTLLYKTIFNIG